MKKSRQILSLILAFFLGVTTSQIVSNFESREKMQTESISQADSERLKQIFEQELQKSIDSLDRNWQAYHTTLENFKEGSIDLETTVNRLKIVYDEQTKIVELIMKINPTDGKNLERLTKMLTYSREQLDTIDRTVSAAENLLLEQNSEQSAESAESVENPESNPNEKHDYQSKVLQDVMIRNSPVGLFILGMQ